MKYNDIRTRRLGSETQGVCALVQDMMPFYMEDDVSAQSRLFIDEHLETCDRCASFLAGGRSVQEHLRRDTTLRSDVLARDTSAQDVAITGRRQLWGFTLIGAGFAALVVLAVVLGFNSRGLQETAPVTEAQPTEVLLEHSGGLSEYMELILTPAIAPFGGEVSVPVPDAVQPTVVPPASVPPTPDAVRPTVVPPASQ